ncbi:MAG: L-fucose/L-arabinose isomerase family protein [Anaerolineae bacterium]|nr:L-fucose/L-arabinose isomerase family protein [Anaerolineae bacterium]
MKPQTLTVGFVALARTTFDIELAQRVAEQARASLQAAGFLLTGPETLVTNLEETEVAAQQLAQSPPDLLLAFQATFADSTMLADLAARVDAPLLLWAVPEALTGERLRLNSLCGINLGAFALKRRGLSYEYSYAPPDDAGVVEKVRVLAQAGQLRHLLRSARIGRVGENPDGFEPCALNEPALKALLGVEIVQLTLEEVFARVRAMKPDAVDATLTTLRQRIDDLETLDQQALRGTLATYLTLREIATQLNLDGLAVRCWPQFFTELGCAACGAMSMLSDEQVPCSCEADINGNITQLLLQWLSGEPAFGTDMVSFDIEADTAVFWHCGLAPLSMADPTVRPRGTVHSNRKLPFLMEFPLKPGRVTLARLTDAGSGHGLRLVVGGGEMLRAPRSFSGTSGVIRFDEPARNVLDTIMGEGLDHHICLTYGDHLAPLLKLAGMLALPVLYLGKS